MYELMMVLAAAVGLRLTGVCALRVLRMLGNLELPDSPPFPWRESVPGTGRDAPVATR